MVVLSPWRPGPVGASSYGAFRPWLDLSFFTLWAPGGSESLESKVSSVAGSSRASSDDARSDAASCPWLGVVTRTSYPLLRIRNVEAAKRQEGPGLPDPSWKRVVSSMNVGPDGAELLDLALPTIRLVKPIFRNTRRSLVPTLAQPNTCGRQAAGWSSSSWGTANRWKSFSANPLQSLAPRRTDHRGPGWIGARSSVR